MSKVIRVSTDVFARLQRHCQAGVDTPSTAIARLIDYYESAPPDGRPTAGGLALGDAETKSADISTYAKPWAVMRTTRTKSLDGRYLSRLLLVTLARLGQPTRAADVIAAMRQDLENARELHDADAIINSPQNHWERWESTTRMQRKDLVKRGLMRGDARRGMWALTEDGLRAAKALEKHKGRRA